MHGATGLAFLNAPSSEACIERVASFKLPWRLFKRRLKKRQVAFIRVIVFVLCCVILFVKIACSEH